MRMETKSTALMDAVRAGSVGAARRLLLAGCREFIDPADECSIVGRDHALTLAIWHNDLPMVRLLMEHNAHLVTAPDLVRPPLCAAVKRDKADMVQLLLKNGVEPVGENGEPILQYAAGKNAIDSVIALMALGHMPDIPDTVGATPLMAAAAAGHGLICAIFLKAGADPNRCDILGRNPLELAFYADAEAVVKLLLAKGATPVIKAAWLEQNLTADQVESIRHLWQAGAMFPDNVIQKQDDFLEKSMPETMGSSADAHELNCLLNPDPEFWLRLARPGFHDTDATQKHRRFFDRMCALIEHGHVGAFLGQMALAFESHTRADLNRLRNIASLLRYSSSILGDDAEMAADALEAGHCDFSGSLVASMIASRVQ